MIVSCEKCETKFQLKAEALGPEGRKVRCSECGHTWHQLPDIDELADQIEKDLMEEDIPDSVKPVPDDEDEENLPPRFAIAKTKQPSEDEAEKKPGNPKVFVAGVATAAAIFALSLYIIYASAPAVFQAWPASANMLQALGADLNMPDQNALVFERITAKRINENGAQMIEIKGRIVNRTEQDIAVPIILARTKDEDGKILDVWRMQHSKDVINAAESLPLSPLPYETEKSGATHVELQFLAPGVPVSSFLIEEEKLAQETGSEEEYGEEEHGEEEHGEEDHSEDHKDDHSSTEDHGESDHGQSDHH